MLKSRLKLIVLSLTIALALLALWQVQRIAKQVRDSEEAKVRLWASAIGQRNQMAAATAHFFQQATLDEHRKMQLYTDILQSFNDPDLSTDLKFSLAYVNYIVDSSNTPIIITRARDSIITVPQELAGQKLEGDLLEEYSKNPPFRYRIWGMPMTLYYKESEYYTQLREVLAGFTMSFLTDITQNSVLVPVVIVDSSHTKVLAYGNLGEDDAWADSSFITNHSSLFNNDPIEITLPDGHLAYVYYSSTPLLRSLRWLPLFYFFIAIVLIVVSYYLFRTARSAEQNRIWVGLAKETAHQLGTPLSSLSGWVEYLKGKEFTEQYAAEVEKDLKRLETITHRFSKIGSTPELKEEDVREATMAAVEYLQSRAPRRVKFNVTFPENESFVVPLNSYLFQWVVENICKNAIDAMDGDGERDRQGANASPARDGIITVVASQDARRIYIDISDTGRGMSSAVQKHIFDSGFTTKTRGWGLGLTLARRIINQYHRGRLYLKFSVPGQGSCFRIELKKK
ncbi:MAG: HAMP domain-containing histidine kinase [Bacteroidales bacterium]|nr:HAMP domain-containing histidine kinase [Bacteroidales bacterium]